MLPAPFGIDELKETSAALMAEGGLFQTEPMTVRGVEYERVFSLSNMSVRDMFAMKAAEFADREFLVYGEDRLTTAEAWQRAMRFANFLVSEKGVTPGDRVAIAMRNYPEWCIAYLGIAATGACIVPLNGWWQAEELRDGIERAEAKIVICDAKRAAALEPARESLGLTIIGAREDVPGADHQLDDIVADEAISNALPPVAIDPDSDFCLLFTSGSTGKPKGAMLTNRSCINSVLSFSFMLNAAQRMRPEFPFMPDAPATLLALPLFHVTASHTVFLLGFLTGTKIVFSYRWDAKDAIRLIDEEKITRFIGVPTQAQELIAAAGPDNLGSLLDVSTGGAKRPETQLKVQANARPETAMSSGYGLTETNALGTHISMNDFLQHPSSAGRPIPPVTQVETFSEEGEQLPRGAEGEICIKSPVTFRGYLADEEATKAAFHEGGWFRTGDLGKIDEDGYLYILDRKKDLIIRGGENISCLEVENILLGADGVDEVSVFSVPDERFGEIVGAAVWSKEGNVDPAGLRARALEHMAAFKAPEKIWLSPQQLPRGTTGKVDKRTIRELALSHPPAFTAE